MNGDTVILYTALILNIILSLVVLLRKPDRRANIVFSLFGGSIILWTLFNYLADNAGSSNLLYTRLTLLFGATLTIALFELSLIFPKRSLLKKHRVSKIILTAASINALLSMSALYVSSVEKTSQGVALEVGPLFTVYSICLVATIGWAIANFIHQLRQATRIEKGQIKLFASGVFVYTTFALLSNVILPLLLDDWSSSKYGPIFTVPFVAITAYAIIRHRMFDIRLTIVRVLGYMITVGVVAAIYSFGTIVVATQISDIDNTKYRPLIISLFLTTLFVSLTFHHIQEFVTRATTSIFYRHAYSLREVLDRLSDVLVSESKPQSLIDKSLRVLSDAIRPQNAYFVVYDHEDRSWKQYSLADSPALDIEALAPHLLQETALLVDSEERPHTTLSKHMHQQDLELALRLGSHATPAGVVLFGPKMSGNIYTDQDIQLLRIAAKNLSIALENAKKYEQISHFADTLKIEVDHATKRLRTANERLKTLDELKDDFISMASHQFRTPASSIRQALQMINDPRMTQEERDEILKLAEANSQELVTIVGTMLSISRLQAGRFLIDKSLSDLSKLVQKVIETTSILAEQKGSTIVIEEPLPTILTPVDYAKLREAMTNYVENAIKYSPGGSTIRVHLIEEKGRVRFEVIDQGMGVPEEARKSLFGKFYRAQNARKQQPDGNGIGLYVVKSIAEGHGGEAYYKPAEGSGSIFGFWIPIHPKEEYSSVAK
jgi:signal transduction histidine kinase